VRLDNQNISTVTIYGTTTPVQNIPVNFTISTYPAGAEGFSLSKSSETTNNQGIADVQLKLGNIPAEYGVTAFCPSCVPEANSVTFTCCGKLPNDHFSQSHVPAWSYNCYAWYSGNCSLNRTSIGWLGCALTSLATLINYYANTYPELHISTTNPGDLNTYLRRLPIPDGYNDDNDVNFSAINIYSNGRVNFIDDESGDINRNLTREILLNRADNEILAGRPVIFKILRGNGTHFVVVIGKCGNNYVIADPAGGIERLYNPDERGYIFNGIRIFRP
jgi:hypothetical protein